MTTSPYLEILVDEWSSNLHHASYFMLAMVLVHIGVNLGSKSQTLHSKKDSGTGSL